MTVKQILDEKGRKVVTVHSSMNVQGAARFLAENKIGAVIVSDDGTAINGILSERDIVRCLASNGPEVFALDIAEVFTDAEESDSVSWLHRPPAAQRAAEILHCLQDMAWLDFRIR